VHVLGAWQVFVPVFPFAQLSVHAAPASHVSEQVAVPMQETEHPPAGHLIWHALLPWHVMVPPFPTDRSHVLVPSQVRLLPSPALRLHWLPPPHVAVQSAPHAPPHCDLPSHVLVHPVPQLLVHMFCEAHW
jgi:hypothetical protein